MFKFIARKTRSSKDAGIDLVLESVNESQSQTRLIKLHLAFVTANCRAENF